MLQDLPAHVLEDDCRVDGGVLTPVTDAGLPHADAQIVGAGDLDGTNPGLLHLRILAFHFLGQDPCDVRDGNGFTLSDEIVDEVAVPDLVVLENNEGIAWVLAHHAPAFRGLHMHEFLSRGYGWQENGGKDSSCPGEEAGELQENRFAGAHVRNFMP